MEATHGRVRTATRRAIRQRSSGSGHNGSIFTPPPATYPPRGGARPTDRPAHNGGGTLVFAAANRDCPLRRTRQPGASRQPGDVQRRRIDFDGPGPKEAPARAQVTCGPATIWQLPRNGRLLRNTVNPGEPPE